MRRNLIYLSLALALFSCGKENVDDGGSSRSLAAPTGIVTYGTATESSLGFKWDPVEGATGYEYKLLSGEQEVQAKTTTNRFVKCEGLSSGTTYRFAVSAVSGSERSAWSAFVEAKTEGKEPVTPTGIDYAQFQIPSAEENLGALAFPGAEGGGMYTTGGRGGEVYHVTTTSDSDAGSLRNGITNRNKDANGNYVPRTIVFDVAGTITLQSDLKIEKGNLTIAGQTAPGDGICLKNYSVYVGADNVILRFLRFRLGDEAPWTDDEIKNGKADSQDAIWGRYQKDIVLDHCSMSWSIDETASFYANAQFTMQWCVIAESMKSCRLHSKGDHGYGGIWGGKNASFHHNLLAHHQNRTPRFDHQYLYDGNGKSTDTYRGVVDYRNCVNYNWGGSNGCYGGEGGHFNLVNNYYKKGKDSNDKKYFIEADGGYSTKVNGVETNFDYAWPYLYLSGNYNNEYPSGHSSYPDGIYWKKAYSSYNLSYEGHVAAAAYAIKGADGKDAYTTTHSASEALEKVCGYAGASLKRDAVDTRICEDVKAGSGVIVKDMADVQAKYGSAWPDYSASQDEMAGVKDTDGDGIPDVIEEAWGLDRGNGADGNARTLDKNGRYTNLEMYLHYLVKDIIAGGNAGGTYTKL